MFLLYNINVYYKYMYIYTNTYACVYICVYIHVCTGCLCVCVYCADQLLLWAQGKVEQHDGKVLF